jgi:hypothetical protein
MKYLVKPFRLVLGLFLILFKFLTYVIAFLFLFIWELNPKKVYHILIDSYKYDWIYSYKYYVIVDDNGLSEIQDLKKYYKSIYDFVKDKETTIEW